jgi:FkbM family methyltransferase
MKNKTKIIIIIIVVILLAIYLQNKELADNLLSSIKDFIGIKNHCRPFNEKYNICTVKNHKYIINPLDSIVSGPLKIGNYWETFLHKYFKQYSNKELNCLDIGANIGTHTVILSGLFKNVYAFEPQREVYDILKLNLEINNCTNTTPYNFGLGETEKIANLGFMDKNKSNNFGGVGVVEKDKLKEGEQKGETIDIKTLDSLNLKDIGFIKIDVEGYEYNALLGGEQTIRKYRPTIIFEQHDSKSPLFVWLLEIGYKIRKISIQNDYIAIPL